MNKDVFITDDRLVFSRELAEYLRSKEIKVCLTTTPKYDNKESNTTTIEWNRLSPFSLQSLVLQLKKHNMVAETAIIVFDGIEYNNMYESKDIISVDTTCTELVNAYATLSLIIKTLFLKQGLGRLVFIHRECPNTNSNITVSMASAGFIRLAEETALNIASSDQPNVQTLLVKLDGSDDNVYIEWLTHQLSMPIISRNPGRWIKAGKKGFLGN